MSEASGIPSWAMKGAKVACIRDGVIVRNLGRSGPVVGGIYTLDRVFVLPMSHHPAMVRDEVCAVLVECPGITNSLSLFRPAEPTKQEHDLAQFRKLLIRQPVPESEDA